jgi:hypothetical protein
MMAELSVPVSMRVLIGLALVVVGVLGISLGLSEGDGAGILGAAVAFGALFLGLRKQI